MLAEVAGVGIGDPSAPGWARQHHSQRDPPLVPSKRLPDWVQSMAGKCDPPGSPPTGPPGMPLVRGEDHVLAAGMHVSVSVCNVSGCECVTVCVCVRSMPVQL